MAELALGAIGGAVAIIDIAQKFLQISEAVREIRNCPKEIRFFELETLNFSRLLDGFYLYTNESLGYLEKAERKEQKKTIKGLTRQCSYALRQVDLLLGEIFRPQGEHLGDARVLGLKTRFRWYIRKTRIVGARTLLESAKSMVNVFTSITLVRNLNHLISKLIQEHKPIPQDLITRKQHAGRLLKNDIPIAKASREAVEEFQNLNKDAFDIPPSIFLSVNKLDRHIEEVAAKIVREELKRERKMPQMANRERYCDTCGLSKTYQQDGSILTLRCPGVSMGSIPPLDSMASDMEVPYENTDSKDGPSVDKTQGRGIISIPSEEEVRESGRVRRGVVEVEGLRQEKSGVSSSKEVARVPEKANTEAAEISEERETVIEPDAETGKESPSGEAVLAVPEKAETEIVEVSKEHKGAEGTGLKTDNEDSSGEREDEVSKELVKWRPVAPFGADGDLQQPKKRVQSTPPPPPTVEEHSE